MIKFKAKAFRAFLGVKTKLFGGMVLIWVVFWGCFLGVLVFWGCFWGAMSDDQELLPRDFVVVCRRVVFSVAGCSLGVGPAGKMRSDHLGK